MIGLAILGIIIALVLYYAVELPAQQAVLHMAVPKNTVPPHYFEQ